MRRSALSTLAAVLLTSACAEEATAPESALRRTGTAANAQQADHFHPASQRYSNNGAQPARGRSGSASIEARALLGSDGSTLIEATTGALDGGGSPGQIAKVQLKSLNGNGDVTRTDNFNGLKDGGYWKFTTNELPHNAQIQIQANVRGIDPKRTDVVTVQTAVKKRPDVAVSLNLAPQAYTNTMVPITAELSELNGDLGVTGKCQLLVQNTQVDEAPMVWVDAGSSVSCLFSHQFDNSGTYDVTVRFTNGVPAEWSTANNSATGQITIVKPIQNMQWSAWASSEDTHRDMQWSSYYSDCYYYYYYCTQESQNGNETRDEKRTSFTFSAWANGATAAAPLDVSFAMTTDGSTFSELNLADVSAPNSCYYSYHPGTNTSGQVCTSGGGMSAYFSGSASTITYFSETWWNRYTSNVVYYQYCYYDYWYGWYCYWYPVQQWTYDSGYYINSGTSQTGSPVTLGSAVTGTLNITDNTGRQFVAGGAFPTATTNSTVPYNYCYSYGYYYYFQRCENGTSTYATRFGSGAGIGLQP